MQTPFITICALILTLTLTSGCMVATIAVLDQEEPSVRGEAFSFDMNLKYEVEGKVYEENKEFGCVPLALPGRKTAGIRWSWSDEDPKSGSWQTIKREISNTRKVFVYPPRCSEVYAGNKQAEPSIRLVNRIKSKNITVAFYDNKAKKPVDPNLIRIISVSTIKK